MSKNNKKRDSANHAANLTETFSLLVKLEFAERNIASSDQEDIGFTFEAAEELIKFAESLKKKPKNAPVRKEYPVLGVNPFLKHRKNRETNNEKYDEKFAKIIIEGYALSKDMAADATIDTKIAKILKENLDKIDPAAFEEKIQGGPTAAKAARNKNTARMENFESLGGDLGRIIEYSPKWAAYFEELATGVIGLLAKMGTDPRVSGETKKYMWNKVPLINDEASAYLKEGLEQADMLSHDDSLNDPEEIFEQFLQVWENTLHRAHNILKNDMSLAALSAAFVDVHGNQEEKSERFSKTGNLADHIERVRKQMDIVTSIFTDYKKICTQEQSILFTRTLRARALPGENYGVNTQTPSPAAVA